MRTQSKTLLASLGVAVVALLPACESSVAPPAQVAASPAVSADGQTELNLEEVKCTKPPEYPPRCDEHWTQKHLLRPFDNVGSDCGSRTDRTGCTRSVEVSKRKDSDGKAEYCVAKFPYRSLNVYHHAEQPSVKTKVYWKLDNQTGLTATEFSVEMTGSNPGDVWELLAYESNGENVVYKVKDGVKEKKAFCHYPKVTVQGLGACCPGDPIIINHP